MRPLARNDGRLQTGQYFPEVTLVTDSAQEYLLPSASSADVHERRPRHRASSYPSYSSTDTSGINTADPEATTGSVQSTV